MATAHLALHPLSKRTHLKERGGKYLIFLLGAEEFGLSVLQVREIIGMQEITMVPQTPLHLRGVINLRGKVVPVVDLRLKLGLIAEDYTSRTCIIVVCIDKQGQQITVGTIVDSVAEVITLAEHDIEDPPVLSGGVVTQYVTGLAKTKASVKILLSVDDVLSTTDLDGLGQFRHEGPTHCAS